MLEMGRRRNLLGACIAALGALHSARPALAGQTSGPDVTVINLTDVRSQGAFSGRHAYSVGTTSCNVGTTPVWWCDATTSYCNNTQHPVIAQNIYKLKDGRFSQIGMSWLKHGFLSTNSGGTQCLPTGCQIPPHGGDQLGVGCTDTYGGSLNGSRPLGMRSEVHVNHGTFPFPYTTMPFSGPDEWAQVDDNDLDPALNAGARYFVEGHYVTADDAQARNGLNNASYREVSVGAAPSYNMTFLGGTVREKSAIEAWPVIDPTVVLFNVDLTGAIVERYHVAMKVAPLDVTHWHYEFAVHNMNSQNGVGRVSVTLPGGGLVSNVGFKDIDHHSGEPYATTDWTSTIAPAGNGVSWFTESYTTNQNANALRWGTLFNFWFDATSNEVPKVGLVSFKPRVRSPNVVTVRAAPPAASRARKVAPTPSARR